MQSSYHESDYALKRPDANENTMFKNYYF